jgi:hypothetical protein
MTNQWLKEQGLIFRTMGEFIAGGVILLGGLSGCQSIDFLVERASFQKVIILKLT